MKKETSLPTKKPYVRQPAVDLLRLIAIVSVVLIHTTSRTMEQAGFDLIRIPFTFFFNQAGRFAVPLFFILSGYLLEMHAKKYMSLKGYYKRRIGTLLIPYVFWSIFYYVLLSKGSLKALFSFNFLSVLINGSASIQLYFIPTIILAYILFPFLHKYFQILTRWYMFIGICVLQFILLFIDYTVIHLPIIPPLRIFLLNYFLFFLGMFAFQHEKQMLRYTQKRLVLIMPLLVISLGVVLFESRTLYLASLNTEYITSQWRLSIFIYTVTLSLLLFYSFHNKVNRFIPFFSRLSQLSFFVFFIHTFFISLFWKVIGSYLFSKSNGHVVDSIWFDSGAFVFVLFFSFVSAAVVSLIPKIRTLVGIDR